jgi:polysaccharide export outer membrane protein
VQIKRCCGGGALYNAATPGVSSGFLAQKVLVNSGGCSMLSKLFSPVALLLVLSLASIQALAQEGAGTTPVAANSSVASTPAPEPQFQSRSPRYRIQPGDSFDVNFDLSPEYNQTAVPVQPDGFVTLRGIPDVKVAGQTVPELTQTLKQAYAKILNDPMISIVMKDFEKPYFVADGQVSKPGKYDLHGQTTLSQAVAMAGGFLESSKHSQVLLFRRVDDQWTEAKIFNLKEMEKKGNMSEDPVLHPGDMLFVPKNTYSKIERFLPTFNMGAFVPIQINK